MRTWFVVRLGQLDRLNGPAEYPFPTRVAAERFAASCRAQASGHVWQDVDGSWHGSAGRNVSIVELSGDTVGGWRYG